MFKFIKFEYKTAVNSFGELHQVSNISIEDLRSSLPPSDGFHQHLLLAQCRIQAVFPSAFSLH
jgi:hypothetical protein